MINSIEIPHLKIIETHFLNSTDRIIGGDISKSRTVSFELEQLPYSIHGAYISIINFRNSYFNIMEAELSNGEIKPGVIQQLNKFDWYKLSICVDNFLSFGRKTQNIICKYIRRSLGISAPESMHVLTKQIENNKSEVSEDIKKEIMSYWSKAGKKLKEYRDLSEHHAVLSSTAYLLSSERGPFLHIVLPNNPEEKKLSNLSYQNPAINAYEYCYWSFVELYKMVYIITYLLAQKLGNPKHYSHQVLFNKATSIKDYFLLDMSIINRDINSQLNEEKTEIDNYLIKEYGKIS